MMLPQVNCVVIGGINDSEAVDFAELTRDKLVDIRFIEYMPFGGLVAGYRVRTAIVFYGLRVCAPII